MANCTGRVTVTGIDAGGYIYENVFYMNGTFTTESMYDLAADLNDYLSDPFFVTYIEAFTSDVKILTASAAMVLPDKGITHVNTINEFGARDVVQASGTLGLGFKIVPGDGVPPSGHQYVPCLGDGDVVGDIVVVDASFTALQGAYQALVLPSTGLHQWSLGIWNKATTTARPAQHVSLMPKPVVLSKRQRA